MAFAQRALSIFFYALYASFGLTIFIAIFNEVNSDDTFMKTKTSELKIFDFFQRTVNKIDAVFETKLFAIILITGAISYVADTAQSVFAAFAWRRRTVKETEQAEAARGGNPASARHACRGGDGKHYSGSVLSTFAFLVFVVYLVLHIVASTIEPNIFVQLSQLSNALAIGAGFGASTLVQNTISGIMLQMFGVLRVGDIIVLQGHDLIVVDISITGVELMVLKENEKEGTFTPQAETDNNTQVNPLTKSKEGKNDETMVWHIRHDALFNMPIKRHVEKI